MTTDDTFVSRDLDQLVVNRFTGRHFQYPLGPLVNVVALGATMDGTTDDTTALERAVADAAISGGVVLIPAGRMRIRRPILISGSVFGSGAGLWGKPVFLQGAGDGVSIIVWDPITLSDDCIRFWQPGGNYVGGGVRDLTIIGASPNTQTGCGLRFTGTYRSLIQNVTVSGLLGVGAIGLKFDYELINNTCQHSHVMNVHSQGNRVGIDLTLPGDFVAYHLNLNQCTQATGVCRGGTVAWFGGMLQGATPFEFRATAENSIWFRAHGLYTEVLGNNTWKAYAATAGTGFGGTIRLVDCTDNGNNTWADIDDHATIIDSYLGYSPIIANVRNSIFRMDTGTIDPAKLVLDASTQLLTSLYHCGNVTIGLPPEHPASGGAALALGGPAKFWPRTTVQRNALTPAVGWVIFNTTTNKLETWNGAAWVS